MLTRIISAGVGIVIALVVLAFHRTFVLPLAVSIVTCMMLFELLRAVKIHKCVPVLYAVLVQGTLPEITACFEGETYNKIVFVMGLVCCFVIFLSWLAQHKKYSYSQIFFSIACMFLVPQSMSCAVRLDRYNSEGLVLLVMGLCGAWIADAGAYFTGVAIGKHKLCPEISPKKTVEGFIGGIVTDAIVFVGIMFFYSKFFYTGSYWIEMHFTGYLIIALAGAVCGVVGTLGDLTASMIKRETGIKDYGKIMPGHGGMMDRFDSVLFVMPTFYGFIRLTGIFDLSSIMDNF